MCIRDRVQPLPSRLGLRGDADRIGRVARREFPLDSGEVPFPAPLGVAAAEQRAGILVLHLDEVAGGAPARGDGHLDHPRLREGAGGIAKHQHPRRQDG